MRAKHIKIRCSALGKIMTNPRSKTEVLSKTCKTYIEELFLEVEYNIVKDFRNRYTDKGNRVERDSLDFINNRLELELSEDDIDDNSQVYRHNDFIHGSTDLETEELVIDVKNSYDATTFPMFKLEPPNKEYLDQLLGYLWLSGKERALLIYCLIETPEDMVLDEIRREHWVQNSFWNGDEDPELIDHVRAKHNFTQINEKFRMKLWEVNYNEERVEQIKDRITLCREYYNELLKMHNSPDAV